MKTQIAKNQPSPDSSETDWVGEWVPRSKIIKHAPLQVRSKLDAGAVKLYRSRTVAGSTAPPIKVGRVRDELYLVDGWHRMEADALEVSRSWSGDPEVWALVKMMTEDQVRWEAAKANMSHRVQLKAREYRAVCS